MFKYIFNLAVRALLFMSFIGQACEQERIIDTQLPDDWGLSKVNFGHSATVCVDTKNNTSIDRRIAYFEARKELAAQVNFAVTTVTNEVSKIQSSNSENTTTHIFEEKSQSITKTTLRGSKAIKQGYINNRQQYCVTMVLANPFSNTKQFLTDLTDKENAEKIVSKYQEEIAKYEKKYQLQKRRNQRNNHDNSLE